jgi:fumarate hydratase subunit alpha
VDFSEIIRTAVLKLVNQSVVSVPTDVFDRLRQIQEKERSNPITASQLQAMIDNITYGANEKIPLCQDTGIVNFFVQFGMDFPYKENFMELFHACLSDLTQNAVLRPNTIDPFTNQNQNLNGGEAEPPIYWELIPHSGDLVITVLNKGGGAENISRLFMLSPSTGLQDFPKKIMQTIQDAGGKPCPPVILGIGIGGDATKTMYLAKKALLRPLGSRHPRTDIALLEVRLLDEVNKLDIGIMGLGGHSNCLDVRIEYSMRHPASFPVGLIVQCYSHRTLSCKIDAQGKVWFGRLNRNFEFEPEGSF